jgi:hypothetical protein
LFSTSSLLTEVPIQGIGVTGVYVLKDDQSVEDAIENITTSTQYLVDIGGDRVINPASSYKDLYTRFLEARRFHNFSLGRAMFTRKDLPSNIVIESMNRARITKATCLINIEIMGGAISEVSSYDTAFYPRRAKFFIPLYIYWDSVVYEDASQEWISSTFNDFRPYCPYNYIGFPFPGSTLEDYYGKNVPRLESIKRKYDPLGLLDYPGGLK